MRERFQLCCKVVGLLFFCGGLVLSVGAIPRFFMEPQWSALVPNMPEVGDFAGQLRNQMQEAGGYAWRYILTDMVVQGVFPMLLGFYLMSAENLFVRHCYGPRERSPEKTNPSELELNKPASNAPPEEPKPEGSKYAPPEFFE